MGNALSAEAPWGQSPQMKMPKEDSFTVGMSIDEIDELTRPEIESTVARLKRLAAREKVLEVSKSITFGTTLGQYAFLLFVAIVLLVVGTFAWTRTVGTADYDTSLTQSLWLSYTMFIDIGTQTGISADAPNEIKVTVVFLSCLGFAFNLTFLSVVVDNVRTLLDRLYTRYSQLFARDHVVILGWTSKTLFLVSELISMFEDNGGRGDIIVMGDISRYEMLRTIELTFRRRQPPKPRGIRIRVWEGDSAEEDDLKRLSINSARFVVCLSESEDPRIADAQVLETLLALLSLDVDDQVTGTVIAELRTADGLRVVNQLNKHSGSDVLGVQSAAAVDKILGLTALRPAVGESLIELISFEGNNFFFERLERSMDGLTFGAVAARYPLCIVCGVHSGATAKGQSEIVIAPPADRVLRAGDRLLLIAQDRRAILVDASDADFGTASCWSPTPKLAEQASTSTMAAQPHKGPDGKGAGSTAQLLPSSGPQLKLQPWIRQTILVIGWRSAREMADLVRIMSKMLLPGSEIHFLSAVDESVREAALRSEMNVLTALTDLAGGIAGPGIAIQHHNGSPLSSTALELLPLADAAAAIVIGDPTTTVQTAEDANSYSKGAARMRDARTFHITTLLRKKAPELRIVPIYEDILSYRLLKRSDDLLVSDDSTSAGSAWRQFTAVFHRNALETGLIAMQADDPTLVFVLSQLLALDSPSGHKIFSVTVGVAWKDMQMDGAGQASALSFNEIGERVRALAGHVLIGYFDSSAGKVILNPLKKKLARQWRGTDKLIMLRAHGSEE